MTCFEYITVKILIFCCRNEELNTTLRQDIQKMNKAVARDMSCASPLRREDEPQEMHDLRVSACRNMDI